jgi:hypothetical protein
MGGQAGNAQDGNMKLDGVKRTETDTMWWPQEKMGRGNEQGAMRAYRWGTRAATRVARVQAKAT